MQKQNPAKQNHTTKKKGKNAANIKNTFKKATASKKCCKLERGSDIEGHDHQVKCDQTTCKHITVSGPFLKSFYFRSMQEYIKSLTQRGFGNVRKQQVLLKVNKAEK